MRFEVVLLDFVKGHNVREAVDLVERQKRFHDPVDVFDIDVALKIMDMDVIGLTGVAEHNPAEVLGRLTSD